jgi:holo-[acyl-carrier protein] synthase
MRRATVSVGTDLVSVDDVRASVAGFGRRYLERVFTAAEIADCRGEAPRLAARFAAKEATMKALRVGDDSMPWVAIEVVRGEDGAPFLELHGPAQALARRRQVRGLSVSLTHESNYASAVVLAEHSSSRPRRVPSRNA